MEDLCEKCFRKTIAHVAGRCPKPIVHVVIDVDSVARAMLTGHPRLLAKTLAGMERNAMQDVHIEHLIVNGAEIR